MPADANEWGASQVVPKAGSNRSAVYLSQPDVPAVTINRRYLIALIVVTAKGEGSRLYVDGLLTTPVAMQLAHDAGVLSPNAR